MIYIVSGWIRHGTSMMMACLEAGGMELATSDYREEQAQSRFSDDKYRGNPRYAELSAIELAAPDFPLPYEGKVVKCLRWQILSIPANAYRIVYMRRDPEETRQSMQALLGAPMPAEQAGLIARETERIVGILRQRRDCEVIEVPYRAVLGDPGKWFETIAAAGWPIDPALAAGAVDPSLCRFRSEEITAGV